MNITNPSNETILNELQEHEEEEEVVGKMDIILITGLYAINNFINYKCIPFVTIAF